MGILCRQSKAQFIAVGTADRMKNATNFVSVENNIAEIKSILLFFDSCWWSAHCSWQSYNVLQRVDLNGVPFDIVCDVISYYEVNKSDYSDWIILPIANFDCYYGNTNSSKKWISKIPYTVLTREVSNGICRVKLNIWKNKIAPLEKQKNLQFQRGHSFAWKFAHSTRATHSTKIVMIKRNSILHRCHWLRQL